MAVTFPRSRNGGESLKLRLRKPIIVVRLVRNTGWALIRTDSTMASPLSEPCRMAVVAETSR